MQTRIDVLNEWCRHYLPDFADIRTDFESGKNLILLLQALKPGRSPSGPYDPDPQSPFDKRRTRDVAVRFAKDLGARGDFSGAILDPHSDFYPIVLLVEAIIVGVAGITRFRRGERPPLPAPPPVSPGPRPRMSATTKPNSLRRQSDLLRTPPRITKAATAPLNHTLKTMQLSEPFRRRDFSKLEEVRNRGSLYARLNDSMLVRMRVINAALAEENQREFGTYFELTDAIQGDIGRIRRLIEFGNREDLESNFAEVGKKLEDLKGVEEFLNDCGFVVPGNYGEYEKLIRDLQSQLDAR
jgi:hypothetical protein